MSVTNLFRDQLHCDLYLNSIGIGNRASKGKTILMNSDGIVRQTKGMAFVLNYNYTHIANSWGAAGVLIKPPIVDATPYRIQATIYNSQPSEKYIVVGHAPLAPTGTNDLITNVIPYPNEDGVFDQVVLVPAAQPGDEDKPIAIGIAIGANGTSVALIEANISVQNLAQTAPQFAASMS